VNQKYALLPAFLQAKGLIRQHVSSFNHFIGSDLLKIIKAKGNERVTCDADPNFYLRCGAGGSPDGGSAACSLPRRLAGRQAGACLPACLSVLDVVPPCAALLGSPSAAPSAPASHPLPPPLPPLFHPLPACLLACRRYTAIYVGRPSLDEEYVQTELTPNQCRLRDQTYSAPISVDLEYSRGKEVVIRKGKNGAGAVIIGRMPIMLRSDRWAGGCEGAAAPSPGVVRGCQRATVRWLGGW
jgi:hypothetical protein